MSASNPSASQSLRDGHGTIVPSYDVPPVDAQDKELFLDSPYGIQIRATGSVNTTTDVFPVSERAPLLQPLPPIPRLHELPSVALDDKSTERTLSFKILREEFGVLAVYTLPVLGAQLFQYSFIMASVIFIGRISTLALAAATLGSMTAAVTGYSIVQGFTSSLDTLLPPAWTSDKPHMVGLWTQRTALFTGIILIPITAIWLRAEPILLALNQEPEVARLAGVYLRYASLGLPGYSINCISRRYFQSQCLFSVPMRIILVFAPINVFLNWLFVYPLGLSFPGAPLATALSFTLVSVASIIYGYFYVPRTAWSPITRESLIPASGEIWKGWGLLARLGFAGVCQTASKWWSWELIGLAASQLGPVALAAQSVLLISASATSQVQSALSIAISVRIGNLLGKGNSRRSGLAGVTSVVMAITNSCIISVIFLVFRHRWGYLFNNDHKVVLLVASVLPVVALFQVFDGIAGVTAGIFRARGQQVTGAILNIFAYYVLGIPIGLYLAFVCGHALVGLWEGFMVALVCCAGVGLWIGVYNVDWKAEVEIAQGRAGTKNQEESSDE